MSAEQTPLPFTPQAKVRTWRILMADNSMKVVEALTFRVEGGALLMVKPAGCVAAFAAGVWRSCEPEGDR